MIPKYIDQKIDRLYKHLRQANNLRYEIEAWAESRGIDTTTNEWYENVVDDCSAANGIFKDSLQELLENNL